METFERARLDAYFARIAAQFTPGEQTTSFLITHLLAERPAFVRAVAAMTRLTAVLPKPKSVHPAAKREVERTHMVDTLTREIFAQEDDALEYLESRAAGQTVTLLDVGGYFAPTLAEVHSRFTGRITGVIEDTRTQVGDHVTRYQTTGHYFYLANGGNAVNFIHGASVGPFIFLVQAEILAAIRMLARGDLAPGIHEVPEPDREAIAATWLSYFNR